MKVLDRFPWIPDRFCFICEEQNGRYAVCDCPIRCHRNAKVRFTVADDGTLLFKCMRDCPKLEMLRAVGLGWKDCWPDGAMPDRPKQEIVARYPYHDEHKRVLYQTIRLEPGLRGRDKDFRQRRPKPLPQGGWVWDLEGTRRVLYRLPELIDAPADRPVFVVAGEKDADNLRLLGLLATTNVCGERSEWLDSYSQSLAGRDVIIVQDRDGAGKRHANEVRGSLMDYARSIRCVVFPEKDATAFLMRLRMLDITAPADLRDYVLGAVEESPRWTAA